MTSEGPQRPGHEPEEAAQGAAGPAPHGGHGTTYGRQPASPFDERNQPESGAGWAPPGAGRWGVQEDSGESGGGWRTAESADDRGPEQDPAGGNPAAWSPSPSPSPSGWATQPADQPDEWSAPAAPATAWAPPGALGPASAADWPPEMGDQGAPDAEHDEPPAGRPRWSTADIPPPAARADSPAPWSPGTSWGTAQPAAPEVPPARDADAGYGAPPPPADAGYDPMPPAADGGLPRRGRDRRSEEVYQPDNGDSMAFGAMSQDSGELPAAARNQPWPAFAAGNEPRPRPAGADESGGGAGRGEQPPAYQPGPGPGISPGNAVPLPPQVMRVPGAALAAAHDDEPAPAPWQTGSPDEASGPARSRMDDPYAEAEQRMPAGSGAGAQVPQQRSGGSQDAAGDDSAPVTASASVPLASRVMPPTDYAMRPTDRPTPQPRVYGRPAPAEAEPDEDAAQAGPPNSARPASTAGRRRTAAGPRTTTRTSGPRTRRRPAGSAARRPSATSSTASGTASAATLRRRRTSPTARVASRRGRRPPLRRDRRWPSRPGLPPPSRPVLRWPSRPGPPRPFRPVPRPAPRPGTSRGPAAGRATSPSDPGPASRSRAGSPTRPAWGRPSRTTRRSPAVPATGVSSATIR
ncbi:hypothetical protein [Plantactinospora sp. KBS50]|uniref:hypothetical protein n=1 Tax=Plantactinospora sp. KBS50 TaxID=2024580 RepID=UPI0012FE5E68|nr:hypothetical protein [Plantactinospora sp. KBS50]